MQSVWICTLFLQDMSVTDSHGASIMAEEVSVLYGDRRDVRILDLASGAGLVGKAVMSF